MMLNLMVHNLKMEAKELLEQSKANNAEIKKLIDEAKDLENLLSA